jgi:hypothetical protein
MAKTNKSTNGTPSDDGFSFGRSRIYAQNAEYANENLRFAILAVAHESGTGFEGRDRWAVTVKSTDREPEVLTFGCNPKRDEEFRSVQAHLARGGTIPNVRLRLAGGAYYFTDGD